MEAKIHSPTIFIILGATGDLANRKIIPALFELFKKEYLGQHFKIIGFSRRELTSAAYRQFLLENNSHLDKNFLTQVDYVSGNFDYLQDYIKLAKQIRAVDVDWGMCTNKIFYLSTPPQYYETILTNLHQSESTHPCSDKSGFIRVAIEKPFGQDLATARQLDALLGQLFQEEEIYRVDHYLGKETVQNILNFRFSNIFFEPIWSRDFIDKIEIILAEKKGIEGRGEFYDGLGALIDVGQNHVLQLLALMLMENPIIKSPQFLQEKKAEILSSLSIHSTAEIINLTQRGQYQGYLNVPGVSPQSQTETYFNITTYLNHSRYSHIPIILKSGKKMKEDSVEIRIGFKEAANCVCLGQHNFNQIVYRVQPNEGIEIQFLIKKLGEKSILQTEKFSFSYQAELQDAYENILLDILAGDQTLFVSTREILASWNFITPILQGWRENLIPLQIYQEGIEELKLPTPSFLPTHDRNIVEKKGIAIIGLGKMGKNIALRLNDKGWRVIGFNRSRDVYDQLQGSITLVDDIESLIKTLPSPRLIWLMLSHQAVDELIDKLKLLLTPGDILIDGGNSFYQDSIRRAEQLKKAGVNFIDIGVSGGPVGALTGAVLLIGGEKLVAQRLEPLYQDLAAPNGYLILGQPGAGHFVKMVHNGIEYGMMQSIAEGFNLFKQVEFDLDLAKIADVFNHSSVIESRLVGWLKDSLADFGQTLEGVSGQVEQSGEGEWTVEAAKQLKAPIEAIEAAVNFRKQSQQSPSYLGKLLTALRHKFGGHKITS